MNPALLILIFIGLLVLWLLLAWVYKPLGTLIMRIWNDAMEAMNEKKEEQEDK